MIWLVILRCLPGSGPALAGFDPDAGPGGYGLRGMRARILQAGGSVAVRTAPGEGTALTVQVPA